MPSYTKSSPDAKPVLKHQTKMERPPEATPPSTNTAPAKPVPASTAPKPADNQES